ncbi:hypothetical protein LINPERPRIM_LOCUS32228, partial [Linum perenne]
FSVSGRYFSIATTPLKSNSDSDDADNSPSSRFRHRPHLHPNASSSPPPSLSNFISDSNNNDVTPHSPWSHIPLRRRCHSEETEEQRTFWARGIERKKIRRESKAGGRSDGASMRKLRRSSMETGLVMISPRDCAASSDKKIEEVENGRIVIDGFLKNEEEKLRFGDGDQNAGRSVL